MSAFLHFFYLGHPWYSGQVWGNVFVIAIVAPLGWVWARTKFWPLRPLQHGLKRLEAHHARAHEHNEWAARQIARMHLEVTGQPADQHPHHPDIGGAS
jgi:hypothetical protein